MHIIVDLCLQSCNNRRADANSPFITCTFPGMFYCHKDSLKVHPKISACIAAILTSSLLETEKLTDAALEGMFHECIRRLLLAIK